MAGDGALAHTGEHAIHGGMEWHADDVESGVTGGDTREAVARPLARALGWASIGLGLAQLVAPARVAHIAGIPPTRTAQTIMRLMGAREITSGLGVLTSDRPSPWLWGRVAGDALDLGLLGTGIKAGGNPARIAAAMTAVAGTAAADVFDSTALHGVDESIKSPSAMRVKATTTIYRSADDLYRFWSDFENLPHIMTHLVSVELVEEGLSHWTARSPLGGCVSWDARIVEQSPGNVIAWESVPGSQIQNAGVVRFRPAPGDRGTEVHVELQYMAPAGPLGSAIAKIVGEDPVQQVKDELRRFKQVMETGQVVRSEGAMHGTDARYQPKQRPARPSRKTGESS